MRKTAAALFALASCAAAVAMLSAGTSDPGAAMAKGQLAQRILADLENQQNELADEERKFKAETDILDAQARELAVTRASLERQIHFTLGFRYTFESGLTVLKALQEELAAEVQAMERQAQDMEREREALEAAMAGLEGERDMASPARAAQIALEIENTRAAVSRLEAVISEAFEDIAIAAEALND